MNNNIDYCLKTSELLDDTNTLLFQINNDYYNDVIYFLNMIFDTNESSLNRIKGTKIILNNSVMEHYNDMINEYKINKPLFDIEKFDYDTDNECVMVALSMANNLLYSLDYKIVDIKMGNNYIFKIYKKKL